MACVREGTPASYHRLPAERPPRQPLAPRAVPEAGQSPTLRGVRPGQVGLPLDPDLS